MIASLRDSDRWAGQWKHVSPSALQVLCWSEVLMVTSNLARIPVFSADDRSLPITINELCVGAMLLCLAAAVVARRRLVLDRVAVVALLFATIGAASAVWSKSRLGMSVVELAIALSYLFRWLAYFGIYLAVTNSLKASDVESLWKATETMLLIFAGFGIFQSAFLPGFAQMVYPSSREYIDWDVQGHRLVSTVLEPNIAGTLLLVGLMMYLGRIAAGARVNRWSLLVICTALVLTISRSAVFGVIFGALVILWARGLSRRLIRLAAIATVLLLICSPLIIQYAMQYGKFNFSSDSSAGARVISWLMALEIIADHPLIGVGFNSYKYAARSHGSESIGASSYGSDGGLLFIMAMTGIVGVAVYCSMLCLVIAQCRRVWRDETMSAEGRGLAIGTAAATVGVVMQSVFVNAILTTMVMQLTWVLWAMTSVIARQSNSKPVSASAATPRVVAVAA